MAQIRRFGLVKWFLVVFLALNSIAFSTDLFGAEQKIDFEQIRYRVFSLRKISAEKGRQILADTCIGNVSKLPGANTLLVTGSQNELNSASNILRLIDADKKYFVETLCDVSEAANLPSNERIAAEIGNIFIGTFSDSPVSDKPVKAMIDICKDKVMVIATKRHIKKIVKTAGELKKEPAEPKVEKIIAEKPEKVTEEKDISEEVNLVRETKIKDSNGIQNEDELFNMLIKSLGQAEKAAEQQLEAEKVEEGKAVVDEDELIEALQQPTEVYKEDEVEQAVEQEVEQFDFEEAQPIRSYKPEPVDIAEEVLELDLPEKLNIIDLVDLIGKYLNLDYMYDPKEVTGDVSLKLQGLMKISDLYPLLESVLKFKGFVMSRSGNLVTIVKSDKALNIDPTLFDDDQGRVQFGDVIITRIFELKYLDTKAAQNLLGQMKLGVNVTPIAETGTLIVTGYTYRMSRIEQILRVVDKPGVPREFRFRQLRYTIAKNLASKVSKLAKELGTVSVAIAAPSPVAKQPPKRAPRRRARAPKKRPAPEVTKAGKPSVYLDVDERTNRILMIGQTVQLDVVEKLIDALDVEKQDLRTLRLYDIQHVDADEVKKKLEELGIIGTSAQTKTAPSRTSRAPAAKAERTEAASRPPKTPRAPGASDQIAPLAEEPQVVIIESTNSLLVNATAGQHTQIALIVGYVDSETIAQAIPYEIYPLENQNPEDLAGVLQKLIQETVKDKEGKVERIIKREEDIVIVPDENTFSLIVYASKKNQDWIKKLIHTMDRRRPQVLIDVSLVEITKDEDFEYDLSLITNADGSPRNNLIIRGATLPLNVGASTILEAGFNLLDNEGRNTKTVRGFYSDDRIQALLSAIDSKGYGRILAKPKILVNDNEEGVINTTERTFVGETTQSFPGEGQTPVTTTKWTPYDAKIELSITPHISEGQLLRLDVEMVREDFEKQETAPPDYSTSNIRTTVTVPDGSTIILGGLTKLKQTKSGSKVPILGDIPLIGALFRSADNSNSERKLYIFVKANILRPDDIAAGLGQLQQISARNRESFEVAERSFQEYQTFPGMKPEPLEPLKVLEAE